MGLLNLYGMVMKTRIRLMNLDKNFIAKIILINMERLPMKSKLDTFFEYVWMTVFAISIGVLWAFVYIQAKGW